MTRIQDDTTIINAEHVLTDVNPTNDENDDWANFMEFENKTDEVLERNNFVTPPVPPPTPATTISAIIEENTENDWADFESNTVPYSEQPIPPSNEQQTNEIVKQKEDDDDDFG